MAFAEGEGDFLHGGRAGFADVIAGDRDGVPLGKFVAAPGKNIGDDAHRRAHRINVRAARDVFLEDVVLHRAGEFGEIGALLFGDGDVEAEQNRGGGVDGHRRGDFFERDAVEKSSACLRANRWPRRLCRLRPARADDRNPCRSAWARSKATERPALAFAEQIAIALVGFGGAAEAGVLAHGPEAAAVHRGIDAARVGKFAGVAEGFFRVPRP